MVKKYVKINEATIGIDKRRGRPRRHLVIKPPMPGSDNSEIYKEVEDIKKENKRAKVKVKKKIKIKKR